MEPWYSPVEPLQCMEGWSGKQGNWTFLWPRRWDKMGETLRNKHVKRSIVQSYKPTPISQQLCLWSSYYGMNNAIEALHVCCAFACFLWATVSLAGHWVYSPYSARGQECLASSTAVHLQISPCFSARLRCQRQFAGGGDPAGAGAL